MQLHSMADFIRQSIMHISANRSTSHGFEEIHVPSCNLDAYRNVQLKLLMWPRLVIHFSSRKM
jgi:hypothetical protein